MATYKADTRDPFDVRTVSPHTPRQVCAACGTEKELSAFRETKSGGHYRTCRACITNKTLRTFREQGIKWGGLRGETEDEPERADEVNPNDKLWSVEYWLAKEEFDRTALLTDNGLLWRAGDCIYLRKIGGSGLVENFSPAVAIAFAGGWLGIVYN